MKKNRTNIPADLVTDAIFLSDYTCCVCQVRGKAVQLHHIDENPSNNIAQNLALLCLECHNDTQLKGGFGRKLNAELVIRYKNYWVNRVEQRRVKADEVAFEKPTAAFNSSQKLREVPIYFINGLPEFRTGLLRQAEPEWNTGATVPMIQASYNYIDALQGMLVTLAQYYSPNQFGNKSPQEFCAEAIAARFAWHYTHAEPNGPGTGGSMARVAYVGNVLADVERMVEEFVISLVGLEKGFDEEDWLKRWRI